MSFFVYFCLKWRCHMYVRLFFFQSDIKLSEDMWFPPSVVFTRRLNDCIINGFNVFFLNLRELVSSFYQNSTIYWTVSTANEIKWNLPTNNTKPRNHHIFFVPANGHKQLSLQVTTRWSEASEEKTSEKVHHTKWKMQCDWSYFRSYIVCLKLKAFKYG